MLESIKQFQVGHASTLLLRRDVIDMVNIFLRKSGQKVESVKSAQKTFDMNHNH